jgi:hypothetical protein
VFGKFFDTADVDRFGDWILGEMRKALPPTHDASVKNIGQKADRLNKTIEQQTAVFCKSTKLNIYKKARLAARVREGMQADGYPKPFVQSFSIHLLRTIEVVSKRSS